MKPQLLPLLLLFAVRSQAEKLPLKIYTTADGLAHNSVNRIVRDSHGYLWFCTSEGLSRFDGYDFHTYKQSDGLPHRDVHDLLETRGGEYWIATSGGLCRYQPKNSERHKFRTYLVEGNDRASFVNVLLEDQRGQIWCGTDDGLFRLVRTGAAGEFTFKMIDLGMPTGGWFDRAISALLEDVQGDLWIGSNSGLFRWRSEGHIDRYTEQDGLPNDTITALSSDPQHRVWVATNDGMCILTAHPNPGRRIVETVVRTHGEPQSQQFRSLLQGSDGTIWAGTNAKLSITQFNPAVGSWVNSNYAARNGLPPSGLNTLAEDAAGNLWMGTDGEGAARLSRKTLLTYTAEDGLAGTKIDTMLESGGTLCVVSRNNTSDLYVNEFDGSRFRPIRVNLPPETELLNWGARSQSVMLDREGNWWVASAEGLFRFGGARRVDDLGHIPPARFTERDGLPSGQILAVFEDAGGEVWVSTTGRKNGLARWDHSARRFHAYTEADGSAWIQSSGVSLLAGDGSGSLWLGLLRFGKNKPEVARLHGTSFQPIGGSLGLPSGGVRAMHIDSQKRLWVGTNQSGVMRFDFPGRDPTLFARYDTSNGLSSDVVLSLAEDVPGRIYIANGSGVDRLDVVTGEVLHYTSADGLAPGEVYAAFCDRHGSLWFGAAGGLSRLVPQPRQQSKPPSVVITELRVAGVQQPVSDLGESAISGSRYSPAQNDIEVSFTGLAVSAGETLRYQYRLEGSDANWSSPSLRRSVNYANLSPASYRFLVRAINSDGGISPRPASVSFLILPPFWLRWWFQLLVGAIAASTVYWLHRYRVKRLLALEQIRTRIATDLHDDIGSSLSQIAILSEVANRQVDRSNLGIAGPLEDIADISRNLVDSMSDIVWATDPERDYLRDLVYRMRRFASDTLSPSDIHLRFQAPDGEQELRMSADVRRQIFLIFKEAVHNLARHSAATEVCIDFRAEHGWLNLEIADNGTGFDPGHDHDGHGLRSMRERARQVNGTFEVVSGPGGTTIDLWIPFGSRRAQRARKPHK